MAQDTRKQLRIQRDVLDPRKPIAERERRSLTKQAELVLELARPAWEKQQPDPEHPSELERDPGAARWRDG